MDFVEIEKFLSELSNMNDSFLLKIEETFRIIELALERYQLETLVVSFNGGKDACVIFYLVRYVLQRRGLLNKFGMCDRLKLHNSLSNSLDVVYFRDDAVEFSEIIVLLDQIREKYSVTYTEFSTAISFKEGMRTLTEKCNVQGVFMGLRRGDPYTEKATSFDPSTPGWPQFMRIYPILEWTYVDGKARSL